MASSRAGHGKHGHVPAILVFERAQEIEMIAFFELMGMMGPVGDAIVLLLFAAVIVGLVLWWRHLDKKRLNK
jgi:hypothetical protein